MSSLPSVYQSVIAMSRYARYLPEENRRETWEETVDRMVNYLSSKNKGLTKEFKEIREAVLNLEIMPSMRLMMSAGEACERDNIAAYNCSYLAMNNKRAFSEALYILMNGTGVGFSCERQEISKLPSIPDAINNTDDTSSSSPHVELISPSTMLQSRVRSRRSIPVLDESGRASPSDKKESYSTYSTLGGLEALSTAAMRLSN